MLATVSSLAHQHAPQECTAVPGPSLGTGGGGVKAEGVCQNYPHRICPLPPPLCTVGMRTKGN